MRDEEWIKAANADIPEAGGGWDNPSGEVWAGIRAALQQRRRRRILFWWWLGAGVTALALLAWVLQRPAQGVDTPLPNQQTTTALATQKVVPEPCEDMVPIDFVNNASHLTPKKRATLSLPIAEKTLEVTAETPFQPNQVFSTSTIVPDKDVPLLPNAAFTLLENPAPAIPTVTSRVIRAPHWWVGISGVYPLQADLLSAQSEIPAYAALQEKLSRRRDWSVRTGIAYRKWRFFSGVGTYNLELHTQLNSRLLYDPQLERPAADNTIESTYALSVPSGYGRIDCEVDFFRSSDRPVTPGRAVPVRIDNRQQLQVVQVPFGINYRFARWRSFSANVGGGLAANWVVDRDMEINATSRLEGLNLRRVRRLATSGNQVEPRHLSGWLEASAGWALSPAIELALHTSWHQTLTPVSGGNATARHLAVGGGIYYKF
ncbi:MAG: hypothetical protein HUU34_06745 [Saprospiraceae bacterium]|nr:hypothetical protein [Saprospiraceae bacterium]